MEEVKIVGEVEAVIYKNDDNGYAIFTVLVDGKSVTCVGTVPDIGLGEELDIKGTWINHPSYGKQVQITYYEKSMPTTLTGMEKYLSSGFVKGVGKKTAEKIVELFGEDTFYIIENDPEKLTQIRGINIAKAERICKSFREQYAIRNVMIFLQKFDISPAYATSIYKKYKERTFEIVEKFPYRLADDIWGIGFKMADRIAMRGGIAKDDPERIKSAIKYVLNQGVSNGNCYLPKDEVVLETERLLEMDNIDVDNTLREMQVEGQVWQETYKEQHLVYLNFYYHAEMAVAKKLLELSKTVDTMSIKTLEKSVEIAEKETGVALASQQKIAVMESIVNGVMIITGGPGTGKTTTINTIIQLLQKDGKEVVLTAPTGRAAKRMTEATGVEAKTIHRLLGTNFVNEDTRRQVFDKNEEDPIDADAIIVDEASMIDINLMYAFLRAVSSGTNVVFVGDVDQLPSVGAGNVLSDMINSELIKVVRLNHVFRQAQESAIIRNAHCINGGQDPVANEEGSDFFFMRKSDSDDIIKTIKDLVTTRLPKFFGMENTTEFQILSPMRKGLLGVQNLNEVLQETLNPETKHKEEVVYRQITFREGDKVMQIKNNYSLVWRLLDDNGKMYDEGLGVYNGDIGKISIISKNDERMIITFDDGKVVAYDFSNLEELELAYAITIHKSQGSEYPVVIMPIYAGPPMLMTRNLLYTAITRAKKLVVLVGASNNLTRMVQNNKEVERYTGLARRINNLHDFMFQN